MSHRDHERRQMLIPRSCPDMKCHTLRYDTTHRQVTFPLRTHMGGSNNRSMLDQCSTATNDKGEARRASNLLPTLGGYYSLPPGEVRAFGYVRGQNESASSTKINRTSLEQCLETSETGRSKATLRLQSNLQPPHLTSF